MTPSDRTFELLAQASALQSDAVQANEFKNLEFFKF